MTSEEIHKIVVDVMIKEMGYNTLSIESVPLTARFNELNFDSLTIAQLALAVEDRFETERGVKLRLIEEDFEYNTTVADFVKAIERKLD